MKKVFLSEDFFEETESGIMIVNENLEIIKINTASEKMTGYKNEEVRGKHIKIFRTNNYEEEFHDHNWETLKEKGIWEGEAWNRHNNGELYLVKRTAFKTENENGETIYVMLSRDITEIRDKEKKFNDIYYKDVVTGLPDKHMFEEILQRALKKSKRKNRKTSIIFLDIARFRKVNESFGYAIGDELLKEAAERMRIAAGEDAIFTRMGGDLFAFFLPEAFDEDEVVDRLEAVVKAFKNDPFIVMGQEIYLSINMGVSFYPQDGETHEELFRNADIARSRAKESGENGYQFYTRELNVKVFEKLIMETNLKKAIKGNQLILYYQPQINVQTGELTSYEALIRWEHPELGLVSPGKFIPLAEETGLINAIGEWVIKEACRQNKEWQNKGFKKRTVSVNVSNKQFLKGNLVDIIKEALKETGLKAKYLEVEITESTLMIDVTKTIEVLKELKKLGVKISIDDFGTGYSSLAYLTKLPIDTLKIDRSFIQNIEKNKDSATIASIIITLAHELNLEVVAEGVELKEHLDFLKKENCEKYQGYYFSPPVPVNKIESMFKEK